MSTSRVRLAGLAGAVGGVLTAVCGVGVAVMVLPGTEVSAEMWSYPWSPAELVPVSIGYALLHLLVFLGVLGFALSGVAGPGRPARAGMTLALSGTAILTLAELASIPIADQPVTATGPVIVGSVFGAGTALSAVGLIVTGVTTLQARLWQGWRRYVPLANGCWLAALVVLVMTTALPLGVAIYGLLIALLGVAVATAPRGTRSAPRPLVRQGP